MRYVLDTNVLIDFLIERDRTKHIACVQLFEKIKRRKINGVILGVVVAETVWVLRSVYEIERSEIERTVLPLTTMKGVRVVEQYGWSNLFGDFVKKKVKFVDAMIANVRQVKDGRWLVVSYDRDFDKLGVTRVEPGEV